MDIFRPKKDEYSLPERKSNYDCIPCLAISGAVMAFFGVTLSLDKTLVVDKKADKFKTTNMIPDYFGPKMRYTIRGFGVLALVGAGTRVYEIVRAWNKETQQKHI